MIKGMNDIGEDNIYVLMVIREATIGNEKGRGILWGPGEERRPTILINDSRKRDR